MLFIKYEGAACVLVVNSNILCMYLQIIYLLMMHTTFKITHAPVCTLHIISLTLSLHSDGGTQQTKVSLHMHKLLLLLFRNFTDTQQTEKKNTKMSKLYHNIRVKIAIFLPPKKKKDGSLTESVMLLYLDSI